MEAKKVLSKRELALAVQNQCEGIAKSNKAFRDRCSPCFQSGLPSFWANSGALYKKKAYEGVFAEYRVDQTMFQEFPSIQTGAVLIEYLRPEFDIYYTVKSVFNYAHVSSYVRYTELDVAGRAMNAYVYPMGQEWNKIKRFASREGSQQSGMTSEAGGSRIR